MTYAIRIHQHGDASVLRWEDVEVPPLGLDEVQLRQYAVGLNFIDIYFRTGFYSPPCLPSGLGLEGAGVVEAIGDNVQHLAIGDRVAYAGGALGAYAEVRNIAADRVIRIPDTLDFETAAGMMLQGMTAQFLLHQTYAVKAGDTILVHAAAGGVGLLLCQWAKSLGATVIGTVGSEAKGVLAQSCGCDHIILYSQENVATKVRELTQGEGVAVVYDAVGKDTFEGSLDSLRQRGLLVSYGNASGAIPPFNISSLAAKGSLFVTRPTLFNYTAARQNLESTAQSVIDAIQNKVINIRIEHRFKLQDVALAHELLEGRQTVGKTVLLTS